MILELRLAGDGRKVILNSQTRSLTLSIDEEEVCSFDAEGRMLTAWKDEITYVRGLNNKLVRKHRDPKGQFPWKLIDEVDDPEEKRRFLESVYRQVAIVLENLRRDRVEWLSRPAAAGEWLSSVGARLETICSWDAERLDLERDRFLAVYRPVSILPPDQYLSLVLQATEGCHWNHCTFCSLYSQTRFHIKSLEEFRSHISSVRKFMGASLGLRRSLFLGDANSLLIPQARLLEFFRTLNDEFYIDETSSPASGGHGQAFRGIYSFLDAFTAEKKTLADFAQLRKLHLRRVYLGVESGSDELMEWLNKPSRADQVREVTSVLKEAGIAKGIIILVGIGGEKFRRVHMEATVRLLNRIPWSEEDILYFSPLWVSPDSAYQQAVTREGFRGLTHEEIKAQWQGIRERLRFESGRQPKIVLYDVREFVY